MPKFSSSQNAPIEPRWSRSLYLITKCSFSQPGVWAVKTRSVGKQVQCWLFVGICWLFVGIWWLFVGFLMFIPWGFNDYLWAFFDDCLWGSWCNVDTLCRFWWLFVDIFMIISGNLMIICAEFGDYMWDFWWLFLGKPVKCW